MFGDVLLFWLVHLVIGLLIPIMVYCDRCSMEAGEENADELPLIGGK